MSKHEKKKLIMSWYVIKLLRYVVTKDKLYLYSEIIKKPDTKRILFGVPVCIQTAEITLRF